MQKSDFYFDLPKELIAQEPCEPRDAARLLCLGRASGELRHAVFRDLPGLLQPGDLLVVNNSKVLPARLIGHKEGTGAVCELLLLRQVKGDVWECLAKPGKRLHAGTRIIFGDGTLTAVVRDTMEDGNKHAEFFYDTPTLYEKLDAFGKMPLPPYIQKQLDDQSQYQTVYAKELGSVIKLLATSYSKDGKVYAITAPFMIDSTHPLYNVNDVLNGIYVHGNVLGDVMFFGAGAGKLPTASAVVSDVVDCVKHKGKNVMTIWSSVKQELGDTFDETRKFFVRIKGDDVQAAKAAFGEGQVVKVDGINGEFGFVTEPMTERAFEDAKDKVSVISRIRIDDTKLQ